MPTTPDHQAYGAMVGIEEVLSAPRSPWQNPFRRAIDRLGTAQVPRPHRGPREFHLRRILSSHFDYYHRSRTHLSLNKDAPGSRAVMSPRDRWGGRPAGGRRLAPPVRTPHRLTSLQPGRFRARGDIPATHPPCSSRPVNLFPETNAIPGCGGVAEAKVALHQFAISHGPSIEFWRTTSSTDACGKRWRSGPRVSVFAESKRCRSGPREWDRCQR
jgi:hypothetical protein